MPPLKTPQQHQQEMQDRLDRLKQDYEVVFSTEAGKRVLADIILSSGVDKEIFDSDMMKFAHREGGRRLGIHIKAMANVESVSLKKPEPALRN